jgi:hypothetical protein
VRWGGGHTRIDSGRITIAGDEKKKKKKKKMKRKRKRIEKEEPVIWG